MTSDEMVEWHHQLDGHEFEHTPGDGEGQGSLACCSPWGGEESHMTWWLNNTYSGSFKPPLILRIQNQIALSATLLPLPSTSNCSCSWRLWGALHSLPVPWNNIYRLMALKCVVRGQILPQTPSYKIYLPTCHLHSSILHLTLTCYKQLCSCLHTPQSLTRAQPSSWLLLVSLFTALLQSETRESSVLAVRTFPQRLHSQPVSRPPQFCFQTLTCTCGVPPPATLILGSTLFVGNILTSLHSLLVLFQARLSTAAKWVMSSPCLEPLKWLLAALLDNVQTLCRCLRRFCTILSF